MTDAIVEAVARAIEAERQKGMFAKWPEAFARAAIAAYEREGWRKMTREELKALPHNHSFPALLYDPESKHIGLPCDPWSMPPEDLETYLFRPLPAPPEQTP